MAKPFMWLSAVLVGALITVSTASMALAQATPVVQGPGGANIPANPEFQAGYGNLATNQVTVATTATLIVSARAGGRGVVTVINNSSTPIMLGVANVTTANGIILPGAVGASITIPYSGALYGIVGSGTAGASFYELF